MIVGPRIVKDGLVLHIDAGSERCYQSPNTFGYNLVTKTGLLSGASGEPGSGTPNYLSDGRNNGGTYNLTNYLDANHNVGNILKYSFSGTYDVSDPDFLNQWQFACFVSDAGGSLLYIDGVEITSGPYNNTYISNTSFNEVYGVNYRIGTRFTTAGGWNGQMGQVMLYNRVLTADEIKQNYNATCKRYGLDRI